MIINHPDVQLWLAAALDLYEATLTTNDMATVDALLHAAAETLRFRIGKWLYGFAGPAALRRARPGGSPVPRVPRREVTTYGTDFGTTHPEFQRTGTRRRAARAGAGRIGQSGKIVAAHVSLVGTHA